MSGEAQAGTVAEDYSSCYYNEAHLGGYDRYGWENDQWRGFFQMVADRIIAVTGGGRTLDVGCAKGLLVQALREKGVEAEGFDISEHAVSTAHADVRPHLWVASGVDPIAKTYDLVTCIEVIEHIAPDDAQRTLDRITGATDRVLFSSSPRDHDEPTHVNTKPTATWAAWFAERGFHRRTDVDLTFLSPWAVLFERSELSSRDLVQRYERYLADVTTELLEKRASLLNAHRSISGLRDEVEAGTSKQMAEQVEVAATQLAEQVELVRKFEAEVLETRHSLLVRRDHVVGTEAEIGRLNRQVMRLADESRQASKRVSSLTKRKDNLTDRVGNLRGRVATLSERNKRLERRISELETQSAGQVTLTRRVVARLRRGRR